MAGKTKISLAAKLWHSSKNSSVNPEKSRKTAPLLIRYAGALAVAFHVGSVSAATQERPDDKLRGILIDAIQSSDSFTDRFDAEVWLLDMSTRLEKRLPDPAQDRAARGRDRRPRGLGVLGHRKSGPFRIGILVWFPVSGSRPAGVAHFLP